MIVSIIKWSVQNRMLVLVATLIVMMFGIFTLKITPVDAIPDLSDVQVIIKTDFAGQTPQVVEDQVTFPVTTAMLSVPGAQTVRGYSFFGTSYVYVIFDDKTDIYWARSRVVEYLNQISNQLPDNARPQLGPDATGVGWVYIYTLTDKTGQHDLSELTSLQDWFLKYELQTVAGVSEVATVGGMVKQYQIQIKPEKLIGYDIPLQKVSMAVRNANSESGASVIEMSEAEYMLSTSGYLKNKTDIEQIFIKTDSTGAPVLLKDIAEVRLGPQMRHGVSELNGEGESVGGIIVMRYGENAQKVIHQVKLKLTELKKGLPAGVEIIPVYDRSELIESAVDNLWDKLLEEFLIVTLVCLVFLFHFRSSLVAIITLPAGIIISFIIMHYQGVNANIMSLGGIAIAIGAMVDGAVVLIENMHKHMEKTPLTSDNRWQVVIKSASEVGPALFFSLLIITVSFIPVFTLEAQEGRMFAPLAFTKTYAMAAAALLAITLVPVLMGYFIRGKVTPEHKNPVNNIFVNAYVPILKTVLRFPEITLMIALLFVVSGLYQVKHIGSEFMPDLDEGDLMYMPTTYPGISIGKARELLQQTDKLIKTIPEVKTVFGKVGRADTATDPAPLTMIETFIQFKPKSEWRDGIIRNDIKNELNELIKFPGLTNAWVEPIKTRIDMLATGIKTSVGIKVSGPDLKVIESIGKDIEKIIQSVPGTESVYSERVAGGRYVKIDIQRQKAARYGMNITDVQAIVSSAVGGMNVTSTTESTERYPVNIRYPQDYRNSPEKLRNLPFISPLGNRLTLGDVSRIYIDDGPAGIKSENARINGWILVDTSDSDLSGYVNRAKDAVNKRLKLPAGYSVSWSGQYEYLQRAKDKLIYIIPLTVAVITLLLFMNFGNFIEVIIILGTLPLAAVGGVLMMHLLGFNFSVATAVGFIALAGVSVEIGVIMLVYLNQSYNNLMKKNTDTQLSVSDLTEAIIQGAGRRIRPVMMTSLSIIIGLLPVVFATGTGSEIMSRIAAPMVGGMLSAMLLTLVVLPVIYFFWKKKKEYH